MSSMKLEDFKLLKIIGSGASSKVIAAERDEKIYAIKATGKQKARVTSYGVTEKNILKKAIHPFLIKMIGCFAIPNHLCFVLEYAPGGDLQYYKDFHGGKLPEQDVVFYGAETAQAINFLHKNFIIHRDVKLKNILIGSDGHVKLTDFGSAKDMRREGRTNSMRGTTNYMAPEVLKKDYYSHVVDWWSFGVCLYILLHGKHPFPQRAEHFSEDKLQVDIKRKEIEYPERISANALSVLKGLLNRSPKERLGRKFEDILMHRFFKEIDWPKLEAKLVTPPFIPLLKKSKNFRYFDPDNVREADNLSLYDVQLIKDKKAFEDFDYISPDWQD